MPASSGDGSEATFTVTHDAAGGDALVMGLTEFGLAGLTAADYLIDHLDLEKTGHITVEQLPSITPFENGTPRHHTRFFSRPELDITVLTGELFVPVQASRPFAKAILSWMAEADVQETTILSGVPVAHGPDEHRTFYVATEDYHERRLTATDIPPMATGFLDGVKADLIGQGIETDLACGALLTPVHEQVPDVQAAIRLVDSTAGLYGLDVDTEPLEAFADEIARYYQELADRVQQAAETQTPDDRMYM
ncbi:MAG: proteasome assembly chaperone family protein [Halobacteriaceae archaeon]